MSRTASDFGIIGDKLVMFAIAAEAVLGISWGVPGHLSVDSLIQLYETRTWKFASGNPPGMAYLLGLFDFVVPGTALFVVFDQALLTASLLLAYVTHRNRGPILSLLSAVLVLNPVLIAYTGIVWKDVVFAHLLVFSFSLLIARGCGTLKSTNWLLLSLAAALLACTIRQQGIVVVVPLALAAAMQAVRGGVRRTAFVTLFLLAVVLCNVGLAAVSASVIQSRPKVAAPSMLPSLVTFDIAGIWAHVKADHPQSPIPDAVALAASRYSPYRVDTLGQLPSLGYLWSLRGGQLVAIWVSQIAHDPIEYIEHRLAHLGALFGFGDPAQCLPIFVGVSDFTWDGVDLPRFLHLQAGLDARSASLYGLLQPLFDGPLFRPIVYVCILIIAMLLIMRRRGPVEPLLMIASALIHAATFIVFSIACDFRYLYYTVVAATISVLYIPIRPAARALDAV